MRIGLLALVAAIGFAMAAWYGTATEHSANLNRDTPSLLVHWKLHGTRGIALQSSLALASSVLGAVAGWVTWNAWFLVSAAVLLADLPLTRLGLMPVGRRLDATHPTTVSAATRRELFLWGDLLVIRGLLGTVGAGLFAFAITSH